MTSIKTWFLEKLAELFGLAKTYANALLPVIEGDGAALLQQLVPLALPIVTSLEAGHLPGPEKQKAAVTALVAEAKNAGINAAGQAINLAIELAVANLPKVAAVA